MCLASARKAEKIVVQINHLIKRLGSSMIINHNVPTSINRNKTVNRTAPRIDRKNIITAKHPASQSDPGLHARPSTNTARASYTSVPIRDYQHFPRRPYDEQTLCVPNMH